MNTKPIKQKLEAFCEFINGGAWNESEYTDAGIPVLKVSNIKDQAFSLENIDYLSIEGAKKYSKNILNENDLIVATVGSHPSLINSAAGRTISVPKPLQGYLLNQNAVCIRTKDNEVLFQPYLRYIGETDFFRAYIQARGKGAANQMRIAISEIKNFPINPPALTIQKKIAFILSAYDDLIESNLKRIKLLEEMAQITYEEWFVRLKFPGHETTTMDFETHLPVGWKKRSLLSVADFLNGYAFKPEDLGENGYPVIKIKEIKNGVESSTPRNQGKDIPDRYIVNEGDILFSWSASLEVVIWQHETGLLNQHLFKVMPNCDLPNSFLYLALKESLPIFDNLTTGATMKHIKRKELDFVKIVVPHKDLLDEFNKFAGSTFQAALNLNRQIRFLKEARDILLPRLMTGMIDVEQLVLPELFSNMPSSPEQEPQAAGTINI